MCPMATKLGPGPLHSPRSPWEALFITLDHMEVRVKAEQGGPIQHKPRQVHKPKKQSSKCDQTLYPSTKEAHGHARGPKGPHATSASPTLAPPSGSSCHSMPSIRGSCSTSILKHPFRSICTDGRDGVDADPPAHRHRLAGLELTSKLTSCPYLRTCHSYNRLWEPTRAEGSISG